LVVIPFDAVPTERKKKKTTKEMFKFKALVKERKKDASHLFPFLLHMGKYFDVTYDQLMNDEDMDAIMNALDSSGVLLDEKSVMSTTLSGYAACKVNAD
jgi:hypothetical protein